MFILGWRFLGSFTSGSAAFNNDLGSNISAFAFILFCRILLLVKQLSMGRFLHLNFFFKGLKFLLFLIEQSSCTWTLFGTAETRAVSCLPMSYLDRALILACAHMNSWLSLLPRSSIFRWTALRRSRVRNLLTLRLSNSLHFSWRGLWFFRTFFTLSLDKSSSGWTLVKHGSGCAPDICSIIDDVFVVMNLLKLGLLGVSSSWYNNFSWWLTFNIFRFVIRMIPHFGIWR